MPEIHTIRLPNPFFEGFNRVYLLKQDPLTLIDSGIATNDAFNELVQGLRDFGLQLNDIKRVILTHKHIDHIGNAWRIQQAAGAEILVHRSEVAAVTNVDPDGQRHAALAAQRLNEWNVPLEARPSKDDAANHSWQIESTEATPLDDGQILPHGSGSIQVIHTPGHTAGSICLRFGDILFSGDHVLPDTSPNIGGGDLQNRGLLQSYLNSLKRTRELLASAPIRVMPGHGEPLIDGDDRCDELLRHHQKRLESILQILDGKTEQTVFEVARQLFGEMKSFHVVLGCAEAHAHLDVLINQGRVVETDGRYRIDVPETLAE